MSSAFEFDQDYLEQRWHRTWRNAGLYGDATAAFHHLLDCYLEESRFFHNAQHLEECLRQFDFVAASCKEPMLVEWALWFHDAVYDTHGHENEERSARMAAQVLKPCGMSQREIARVRELILATAQTSAVGDDKDMTILTDIDLIILGKDRERYAEYEEGIALEYEWVDRAVFIARRSELLQSILSRPHIYHHEILRQQYERQARLNLFWALGRLREMA